MSERALMMQRPDLYELLESKVAGYQIRGHPYGIASFPDVNLTITKKWTTFPEDIEAFEGNMDAFLELKHAVEVHSGMTVYKTDCSVCGHTLGFLPRIDSGVCEHKYHLNCFWNYASNSRRCSVCRVPYPRQMYEFFCTIFVPEGSKVINRDTGLQDVENSNPHPDELHASRCGLVAVNEVDVAARNEDKIHLMTEVSKVLRRWRDKSNICGQTFWVGFEKWSDDLTREAAEETYNSIMDAFRASVSHRSAHEHLFDQMKSVFDSYVNPSDKSDIQPLIVGLDRPELDANEFLQQVQHANSDYEVTPSRQTHTDYLEEIGDRTQARLRREKSIRGNGPTARAQSRRLFVQAEEPADPQPQEPQPVETHMEEVVEEILTPSTESTAHEEVASTEPTMDVGSIPAEVAEDPDVKDIGGPSSPGLHMQVYAPKVLQQPSEVVEIGDSPASGRDTRDPLDDWKSYEQLTKKDLESTNPKRFIRGDVINMYIKEKFLVQPRSELEGKFFVNTFWFAQLNALNKQFLSEVAKVKGDLGPYFDDESACRFANVGDVDSFQLIFGMYMDPKGWTAKNLKRRVLP
ncbi:hypothetical protein R1sor_022720 [Riccia sorocarpa]|uniref:RING-type domain-containing protein n=1 Tax=Riccia sorocarpa TaxID=122646 RepID=A0ABD3GPW4_9MARC